MVDDFHRIPDMCDNSDATVAVPVDVDIDKFVGHCTTGDIARYADHTDASRTERFVSGRFGYADI